MRSIQATYGPKHKLTTKPHLYHPSQIPLWYSRGLSGTSFLLLL